MADVNTDQMLPFTLAPLKDDGTPADIDNTSVVYASSDETVMRVQDLTADNLAGNVFPVAAGAARVSVTFDADVGAGVSTITGVSEDVNVTLGPSAQATHFTFTFGAPVPKTGPTPPGP
jgi:hypothetical protein